VPQKDCGAVKSEYRNRIIVVADKVWAILSKAGIAPRVRG
jgi:hypothetical protein